MSFNFMAAVTIHNDFGTQENKICHFATVFLYWFIYGIDALFWGGTYIWSVYPVIFSLIGTAITAYVCYIIKTIKENQD